MKKTILFMMLPGAAFAFPAAAMTEADGTADSEVVSEEADPSQRIRCRNVAITGTRARRVRTCMTIAEWTQMASEGNRDARRVMDNIAANNEPAN
jgi:hypothetical protein